MKLAVLDLDGTLTHTNQVDTDCYLGAFSKAFGIEDVNPRWEDYPHATDSGLADEIFRQRFGRRLDREELNRLQSSFVDLLERARREQNGHYRLVPGVNQFLEILHPANGWAAVIATGSWSRSAALKIAACDLNVRVPLFSCDDHLSRADIVRAAIDGARQTFSQTAFERTVLVGDGIWDLTTARELGYPFVGIGGGDHARLLRENGASHVFEDYRNLPAVVSALLTASIPRTKAKN